MCVKNKNSSISKKTVIIKKKKKNNESKKEKAQNYNEESAEDIYAVCHEYIVLFKKFLHASIIVQIGFRINYSKTSRV